MATSATEAAAAGTKAAGKAVTTAIGKVKTPLIVGGTALAAAAGGAAFERARNGSRTRAIRNRVGRMKVPRPHQQVDLGKVRKLDLGKVSSTAERVGSYGRQVDEVAGAVKRASDAARKRK